MTMSSSGAGPATCSCSLSSSSKPKVPKKSSLNATDVSVSFASGFAALSNAKMFESGRVMLFLHDTEGLAWKLWHHRFQKASAMPKPHDKFPTLVTESGQVLLPMHERFFCVLKCALQVCTLPDPEILICNPYAGFLVKTATAPLSRMTILLQCSSDQEIIGGRGGKGNANRGASTSSSSPVKLKPFFRKISFTNYHLFRQIVKEEGCASFWKGNWASILQKGISTGMNYVFFEGAKYLLKPVLWQSDTEVGFAARTVAGFLGGAGSLLFAYPFDVVRTRLAVNGNSLTEVPGCNSGGGGGLQQNRGSLSASGAARRSGMNLLTQHSVILHAWAKLVEQEGSLLRAYTRGLACTIACQGLNMGIGFGIYETLNVKTLHENQTRTNLFNCLWCGAIAGFWASVLTHPLDLVRRRQQVDNFMINSGSKEMLNEKKMNFVQIAVKLWRLNGLQALYRGLVPELVKVVPAVGLNFYVYEYLRQDVFKCTILPR
ncbi:unnamed protein product [Amoebophrya sp. A120]|nr:unnamed protein product [Amoebophrya sp. A120]|eukprot:GSA120T00007113001.1